MMYKFVHLSDNSVVAITTYAGKTVKCYSKCHTDDTYDPEFGEKLAMARCNKKVAKKRAARAKKKFDEAMRILAQAQKHANDMANYLSDSNKAVVDADEELNRLLKQTK